MNHIQQIQKLGKGKNAIIQAHYFQIPGILNKVDLL